MKAVVLIALAGGLSLPAAQPPTRAEVLRLMNTIGYRAKFRQQIPQLLTKQMLSMSAGVKPCARRGYQDALKLVSTDNLVEDLLRTAESAYERTLTAAEVNAYASALQTANKGQVPATPDDMKIELASVLPKVTAQINEAKIRLIFESYTTALAQERRQDPGLGCPVPAS